MQAVVYNKQKSQVRGDLIENISIAQRICTHQEVEIDGQISNLGSIT